MGSSKNEGGSGGKHVRDRGSAEPGGLFLNVFMVLIFEFVFNIFSYVIFSPLGPILDLMLGLCWELFRSFCRS